MQDGPVTPGNIVQSWGNREILLEFAGTLFGFGGLNDVQVQLIEQRYGRVMREERTAQEAMDTLVCPGVLPVQDDPLRYSENNLYTPLTRHDARGLEVEGFGFRARIELSPRFGGLLQGEDPELLARPIVFENYLRTVAAYSALLRQGLFLHSAGIVIDGRAWLFAGRSGAGKTTLSRLALEAGAAVLSDDANMVLPDMAGIYRAGPVPFAGELGDVNRSARQNYPVAGLLWLEQDALPGIRTMPAALQLARTMACCPVVNVDSRRGSMLLENIAAFLKQVPMRELRFPRHVSFDTLRDLLEKD